MTLHNARATTRLLLTVTALLTASELPALAHHPMGGAKVTTFSQGLLSGLGHPILGLDHLVFMLAIGSAAAFLVSGTPVIAAFLIASFAGVVLHLANVGVPYVEPALAVTVMAAGLLLFLDELRSNVTVIGLAILGGLLHGYALAESIVGVETTPIAAYLIGLTCIQTIVATTAMLVAKQLFGSPAAGSQGVRWTGTAVCLAGAYFLTVAVAGA